MNGTNPTFTLAHDPDTDFSLVLALNGIILDQTLDYTLSGTTITILTTIPTATDSLLAWYRY
jgi:Flp pilus assembly protein TadG